MPQIWEHKQDDLSKVYGGRKYSSPIFLWKTWSWLLKYRNSQYKVTKSQKENISSKAADYRQETFSKKCPIIQKHLCIPFSLFHVIWRANMTAQLWSFMNKAILCFQLYKGK